MSNLTRRDFLGRMAGAMAAASLPRALRAKSGPRRPNVLFLMSDDMRVELGCYGSMFGGHTPHLDALARSGVRFAHNYCQFPLCNPSRSSLLTSHFPTITGVLDNRTAFRDLHPDWISLPQLFRENGYTSIRIGKIFHGGLDDPKAWTIGGMVPQPNGGAGGHTLVIPRHPVPGRPPYDPVVEHENYKAAHSDRIVVLDGEGQGHPDYHTVDETIRYLREYRDRPFFIGCGFLKPHSPPCAPQSFLDLYDPDKIKLTPDFEPWPTVPPGFPSAAIRKRNADLFIGRGATHSEARQVIRAYLASISWTDWNVGRVLAELDRLGLRDNTIIVFTVDHGYQLGEKGKWSKAGSLFEMGTQVPLMMVVPGARGNGQVCTRIVQSLDIYPTLAELCGLPAPEGIQGKSLAPLLENPQAAWNEPAFSVWSENHHTLHGVVVRTERWRYAEFGPDGRNGAMLFDRDADPLEMTNLANEPAHAAVCRELSALTRRYAATMPPRRI